MNSLELEPESTKRSRFDENEVSTAEVRKLDQKFLVLLSVYLDSLPTKRIFRLPSQLGTQEILSISASRENG